MNLTQHFQASAAALEKLTADVSEEHAGAFIRSLSNNIKWQIGHLTLTRMYFLERWNPDVNFDSVFGTRLRSMFDRGSKPLAPQIYPSLASLQQAFRTDDAEWCRHLRSLSPDALASPHSDGTQTLGDLLLFLLRHDAWHCGQIAFVRSQLGHSSLFA